MPNGPAQHDQAQSDDSSARRALITLAVAAVVAVLVLLLWFVGRILLVVFAGVLLAVLLRSLADWVRSWTRLSHGWALAVVVLAILVLLGLLGWLVGAQLARQMGDFVRELPRALQQVEDFLRQYAWGEWIVSQFQQTDIARDTQAVSQLTGAASTAVTAVVDGIVVVFVGLYGAAEPRAYTEGLIYLFPPRRRERVRDVLTATAYTLRWWLLGQLIAMVIVGTLTGLGLWIIGIPFALTLGIIAGFLELVPVIGPIMAAVPGILIALSQGPMATVFVLLLYLGIQSFEGYLLLPLLYRQTVWLPPALTIPAVILLSFLAGLLGLFVAAPLTAAAMVIVKMVYVEDTLGDRSIEVPGEPDG